MKFRDYFSLKQILFALFLFALLIPIALWDSNTQVKVSFGDTSVNITSDKYSLGIPYDIIEEAELTELAEPGEELEETWDNDIIRTGKWENDTWGEYYIVADLDTDNCIVAHLEDGRIFVFSRKDNATTEEDYNILMGYLK